MTENTRNTFDENSTAVLAAFAASNGGRINNELALQFAEQNEFTVNQVRGKAIAMDIYQAKDVGKAARKAPPKAELVTQIERTTGKHIPGLENVTRNGLIGLRDWIVTMADDSDE